VQALDYLADCLTWEREVNPEEAPEPQPASERTREAEAGRDEPEG
jgi:hypothetical protein